MPLWVLTLLSFETGSWTTVFVRWLLHRGNTEREDLLLYGVSQGKSIPILDRMMRKKVGYVSPREEAFARRMVRFMRWGCNTRAFEYGMQLYVKQGSQDISNRLRRTPLPISHPIDTDVRLSL